MVDRTNAASAYLYTRVADVVLGLIYERMGLLFRLHFGADRRLDASHQLGLLGLFEPCLDPCGVVLPLVVIPHFAEQELSFELLARQFRDELS